MVGQKAIGGNQTLLDQYLIQLSSNWTELGSHSFGVIGLQDYWKSGYKK